MTLAIDKQVEAKVKSIIDKLKATHEKFVDEDFGPNDDDEYGTVSLYGSKDPSAAGAKYPAPDSLKWERPQYDDDKFAHTEAEEDEAEEDEEEDDDEYGFSSKSESEGVSIMSSSMFCS